MKIWRVGVVLGLSYSFTLIAVAVIHHGQHSTYHVIPDNTTQLVSTTFVRVSVPVPPHRSASSLLRGHAETSRNEKPRQRQRQPKEKAGGKLKISYGNDYDKHKALLKKAKNKFAFVQIGKNKPISLTGGNTNDFDAEKTIDREYRRLDIGKRFPEFGTAGFDAACPWTKQPRSRSTAVIAKTPNCTIFVRNRPGGNEGVSMWSSQLAHGFIFAQQAGCKFLLDYDGSVAVDMVFLPVDEINNDWRVQPGFVCEERNGCYSIEQAPAGTPLKFPFDIPGVDHAELAGIPNYRWAYSGSNVYQMRRSQFAPVANNLPGFTIEDGMACALGSLFRWAPSAAEFEPRLYTELLPAVRDKDALVLSLYIRTGRTDQVAKKQEEEGAAADAEVIQRHHYEDIVDCARLLEQKHLDDYETRFDRILWLVISDAPKLKQHIVESYGNQDVVGSTSTQRSVSRNVITTGARGIHTRPRRKPSTNEFAEAILDWMLIGEADALVTNPSLSFGFTGAMRTSRPFYDANDECGRRIMVLEE